MDPSPHMVVRAGWRDAAREQESPPWRPMAVEHARQATWDGRAWRLTLRDAPVGVKPCHDAVCPGETVMPP
jgi:hypothetical protein